jgi:hypothetical protein
MYVKKLFISLLIIINISTVAFSDTVEDVEVFIEKKPSMVLRHGFNYTLNNYLTTKSVPVYISDFRGSIFSERTGDLNGRENPEWSKTNILIKNKGNIPPHTTMKIFESKSAYNINYHPKKRRKDNLYAEFHTHYYTWKNNEWSGPFLIITKQPYEVTWCGDGIVDNYTDRLSKIKVEEICDPNDTDKKNWGKAGCSTTCTPLK